MFAVAVHTDLLWQRIQRYLVFETFTSAINCKDSLQATGPGKFKPEDYFEAGKLKSEPYGEVVNEKSIQTDLVMTYLQKTDK